MMKEILYESEMFAEDSTGAVFPFKIIIESELVNDIKTVTVYKKEVMGIGNEKTTEKTTILNSTFWKIRQENN